MTTIGIIGGSGVYELDGLENIQEHTVETPFGAPSDAVITGELEGTQLIFIPRHGRGHRLLPSEVPFRANIFALKQMGAQMVVSVSAVGSMKENIVPGHFVIPNQYIDRTMGRQQTFFGNGIVAHVSAANPICPHLASHLADSIAACDVHFHKSGTYICMEGPAFSTRGESLMYRQWGVDIIGMTAMPEAKLAREAELHYATLALVTDYDCWYEGHDDVSVEAVIETLNKNTSNVKKVLGHALPQLGKKMEGVECECTSALQFAIMTDPALIPEERKEALKPIIGKYLS